MPNEYYIILYNLVISFYFLKYFMNIGLSLYDQSIDSTFFDRLSQLFYTFYHSLLHMILRLILSIYSYVSTLLSFLYKTSERSLKYENHYFTHYPNKLLVAPIIKREKGRLFKQFQLSNGYPGDKVSTYVRSYGQNGNILKYHMEVRNMLLFHYYIMKMNYFK